jgi:hypothetical protein
MATSFVNAVSRNIGTSEVIVFDASQKSVIIGGNLANLITSTVPVSIKVRKGATDTYFYKDKRISAGESFELSKGNKLILDAGDKLIASAQIENSIDAVFSILQGVA